MSKSEKPKSTAPRTVATSTPHRLILNPGRPPRASYFTAPRQGITVRPRIVRMRAGVKHSTSTAWYEFPCCTASSAVGSVHVLLRVRAVRACEPGARRRGIDICGEIRCWPADYLRGHAPITGPCELGATLRRESTKVRNPSVRIHGVDPYGFTNGPEPHTRCFVGLSLDETERADVARVSLRPIPYRFYTYYVTVRYSLLSSYSAGLGITPFALGITLA
ncbi:uncharacterized protein BDZ83DRAFT_13968 [Colletotrichum acutatum]|uniref:Uncharacterized protein n=1 Tax=Glomerella acutata TaxID=27357 RepID=A0AAD8XLS0_GLOAC|nr:uncharacterized protein BDZ83DRAFT_13968 [Colletotrichum acutatum]KAK1729672.1 hypothetical protein BDZ83DRAFT_13968 [Colletotrichum acutatum]